VALTIAFGAAAFVAWLSAFIHGVWSLGHLSGKTSLTQMLFYGIRWFDLENFTPRGQQLQRRFTTSFVAFFGCVLGLIVVAALSSH
jgi:hypothetical protein